MTPEDQARTLRSWLDQSPGSAPPADLDGEVVEAVYTLRPDLAPAPRLGADQILASVTRGPLAGKGAGDVAMSTDGAEIVQFPVSPVTRLGTPPADAGAAAPKAGTRWLRWAGGTGGVGLALVAAATLLVVALPGTRDQLGQVSPVSTDVQTASPAAQAPAEPLELEARDQGVSDEVSVRPPATAAREVERSGVAPVKEMQGGALYREPTVIPEVAEGLADAPRGAADEESAGSDLAADAASGAPELAAALEEDLDQLRSRAARAAGTGWRKGLDATALAAIDLVIRDAAALRMAGDLLGASARLAGAVAPPARAGQYLAWLAATDALAAGDVAAALRVAQRGLALSSARSPEREALLVAFGDALRATGDPTAAADAYRQAR